MKLSWLTLCLVAACQFGGSFAIYDPKATTVKPPVRREPVLPWYPPEHDSSRGLERSPKWFAEEEKPRKPVVVRTPWSPWKATDTKDEQIYNGHGKNQFAQGEKEDDLFRGLDEFDNLGESEIEKKEDEELYEGISSETTKSRQEKLERKDSKRDSKIAKYTSATNAVECPYPDATGQFVYPPDCNFFVNCWQGRAFLQPCAPGTRFNPDNLECDFPHKVECYNSHVPQQTTTRPSNRESRVHNQPSDWDSVGSGSDWQNQYERPAPAKPTYHPPPYHHHVKPTPPSRNPHGPHYPHHGYHWQTSPNSESLGSNRQNNGRAENSRILNNNNNKNGLTSASTPSDSKWHGYHQNPMSPGNSGKWNVEPVVDSPVVPSAPDSEGSASSHDSRWHHHPPEHSNHRHNWHHPYHNWHHPHHHMHNPNPIITPIITPTPQTYNHPFFYPNANPYHHNTQQQRPNALRPPNHKESRVIFDKTSGTWAVLDNNNDEAASFEPPEDSYPNKRDDVIVTESTVNWATTSAPEGGGSSRVPPNFFYPNGIYVNMNGSTGHYITRDVEINQGHSRTRNYSTTIDHTNPYNKTYQTSSGTLFVTDDVKEDSGEATTSLPIDVRGAFDEEFEVSLESDANIPTVSIEYEDKEPVESAPPATSTVEPAKVDFGVDVLADKNKKVWKPQLVFENRTVVPTTEKTTVVMSINKKPTDPDLDDVEVMPFNNEEPPFPVYYVPSVQPISHDKKSGPLSPLSGQVLRIRGGSSPRDGYVEVQGNQPGWGAICDSRGGWNLREAHLVCKQLGFSRGAEIAWQGRSNKHNAPHWIAANTVSCLGNETKFQNCKFTHKQDCNLERDAVGVRCLPNRVAHCRSDEVPHEGQCYHLATPEISLNHAEALEYCVKRNSKLIDITNQMENNFISEWLVQLHPDVQSIMTSGIGFTMFNRTIWLWEDAAKAKFKYTNWWPGWVKDKTNPPWVGSRPACVVMKRKFPCQDRPDAKCISDYFFWDTEDCATSQKGHYYVCKRPFDDIGCVYGNGQQYFGNANMTAMGKRCLPWADSRVAHSLLVHVVDKNVREKLKLHNFCRNPTPNRDERPWCFTGPNGHYEQCDIPLCGKSGTQRSLTTGKCKPKHFECRPGECIPSPWVCDGDKDCTNGADEVGCVSQLNLYEKTSRNTLQGYDVEKWLNTPLKSCARRCKEADFNCKSFSHKTEDNTCLLSDMNVGMTGALKVDPKFDYYEMIERRLDCENMFMCNNKKCIDQAKVCDGKNDCNDRTDENICTVENLGYEIRLAGSNETNEGRVEVKILGVWGQVCDDEFGMIDADVICKELGFELGALEVRPGGYYGNMEPATRFMVDQLKCRGNETSLRECDFDGWGVHNCEPEEAVGVVCKTAVSNCQQGHWKCDSSPVCIPTAFICDEVTDCPDGSDENASHCEAPFEVRLVNGSSPLEGRIEVRHHGVWGTVCDDDFSSVAASVVCKSLGYKGKAHAKKNGFFGAGEGPIWLDEVFCHGNESQLSKCEHNHWGQSNCDHDEDAGVICSIEDASSRQLGNDEPEEVDVNQYLPVNCGMRPRDFDNDKEEMFARVVHGSIAPRGSYPWQASIRVRGHSRSSHWCGAVMISPLHVLTAAHCLEGYNKGTYFVRAGDYNTEINEDSESEANIEDYYIHEDFRKGQRMNNDLALVLLKGRGIPLGNHIMPICLPEEDTEYPPGLNCTISGFGSIETGKSTQSRDLRYGWVPLLDQSVCKAEYVYGHDAISEGMLCAGHLDEGADTCDGDSGGPLACYNNGAFHLYGITSWGQHCGKANKPGVYVKIAHYRKWIDKKIKESLSGQ